MAILKLDSTGNDVKQWQQFLLSQGYTSILPDGIFGNNTDIATRDFQTKHGLVPDGEVGPITWGFTSSMFHSFPNIIKSNADVLRWIKNNLELYIKIASTGTKFTEDWLAAIACRETGGLITRYVNRGVQLNEMAGLMEGDFTHGHYHGFSFWQIDIRSFPDFINSGDWKYPQKAAVKAVQVLEQKEQSLINLHIANFNLSAEDFDKAITAAYNCGEGNVISALENNEGIDSHTANGNYSTQVFQFRTIYNSF